MGKRKIFHKKKSKSKAMKLIRTGHHERTQSHSSSASIDEESVASFQNEPPLNQRNVEDQGRKYGEGGASTPPLFENFVFFAQKNEKNCAFESIVVTNPYKRTCYTPLLPDLEILAVGAPPPVLETELRPC